MKEFIKILRRFVPPYKYLLFLNIFMNVLSTLLSVFSFAIIIPILQILFGIDEKVYQYIEWHDTATSFKDKFLNNFYWYITDLVNVKGASFALMILGIFLVVMTFLKVASSFFSSYFMIPIRTGVVRDIRTFVYEKIVGLPLGFFTNEKKGDVMSQIGRAHV